MSDKDVIMTKSVSYVWECPSCMRINVDTPRNKAAPVESECIYCNYEVTNAEPEEESPPHSKEYYEAVERLEVNKVRMEVAKTAAFLGDNPIINK